MKESAQSLRRVRFATFEVDLDAGEVRKGGLKIKLQEKPFQILAMLLEQAGDVVTQEELRQRLWPADTFVDFGANLHSNVNKLRHALGDSAENPRFVETIPRRGYCFIAPVEPVEAHFESEPTRAEAVAMLQPVTHPAELTPMPGEPRRTRRVHTIALTLLVVAALFSALYLHWRGVSPRANSVAGKTMLLVLPFENLSGDPEQEYFSDGLTDEMIAQLARLQPRRLGVVARTSAMQYKGARKGVPQISRELGVDYVLEGSVRRANGRVRITAQLIQTRDQTNLWAQTYERDLKDVLAIQQDVAERIARSLALELLPAEETARARASSTDPTAYEAYLKGRYYWSKRTEEGLKKSLEYFQQAIQKDPGYAAAYAGLADSYIVLAAWFHLPTSEAYPKAKAAAAKALEIDETLAEAHTSLAGIVSEYDWDWARAEREFQRALELNPAYPTGHQWYAEFLSAMGRHEEALAEIRKARELDPLSLMTNASVGYVLYYARRYDDAIDACRKTLELDPNFAPAHLYLSWAYMQKGMHRESIEERQKAMHRSKLDRQKVEGFWRAYTAGGVTGVRRWLVEERVKQSRREYVPPYWIAVLYAGLGDRDQAFEWLEKSYAQRDASLVRIKVDPQLDPLRSDPRFRNLLQRLRLAP